MAFSIILYNLFNILLSLLFLHQLLALANGDRIKDKQRSKNSFVVDMDKKLAAENLLQELTTYHGAIINQVLTMFSQIKLFLLIYCLLSTNKMDKSYLYI